MIDARLPAAPRPRGSASPSAAPRGLSLRDSGGGVMLEAALALPLFLLFIFGTLEMSFAVRGYVSATRALQMSAHRLASASSMDPWSGQPISGADCLELAGDVFARQLSNAGIDAGAAEMGTDASGNQFFILAGTRFEFDDGIYSPPRVFELQAVYRHECVVCGVFRNLFTFRLTAVAVMETARGCNLIDTLGYFPEFVRGSRVVPVASSFLHEYQQ